MVIVHEIFSLLGRRDEHSTAAARLPFLRSEHNAPFRHPKENGTGCTARDRKPSIFHHAVMATSTLPISIISSSGADRFN